LAKKGEPKARSMKKFARNSVSLLSLSPRQPRAAKATTDAA